MKKNLIFKNNTVIDAINAIESTSKRLAVVISNKKEVLGTITDGDIRRHLIRGNSFNSSVAKFMNNNPVKIKEATSPRMILNILKKNNIRAAPVVNQNDKIVDLIHDTDLVNIQSKSIVSNQTFKTAVIMAGGKGRRLMPITKNLPKPMVEINGIPLLENHIRRLSSMGIKYIYISVNYLSELIKDYFENGKKFDVTIKYLEEKTRLGTAGPLSLLPLKNLSKTEPVLIINGDILTTYDYVHLFDYHKIHNSEFTMCAINYKINIPYGVIKHKDIYLHEIKEKPSQKFLCNAGIYSITPSILKHIPLKKYFDMTDLIEICLKKNKKIAIFPVHEYWTEIGNVNDLQNAIKKFKTKKYK